MTDSLRFAMPAVPPGTAVAITGATGFIGARLAECLVEQGAVVTCLLRAASAPRRLRETGARLLTVDVADPEAARMALAGIDLVFHCAYAWDDTEWNIRALEALIAACHANGCRRLLHVSSFVVYRVPAHGVVSEHSAPDPSCSGYSHTKRQLEAIVLRAVKETGLPAAIVQPTIVYGPFSKPWTIDPADALRYGTVVLPDGGEGTCNAVYVDDVVSAMILAATHPAAVGHCFLVTGPEPVTWGQFYGRIAQAIGAKGPQFRPAQDISRQNGKARRVLALATDPGRVLRRLARIGPCRKLLGAGLTVLPGPKRAAVEDQVFGPATRRRGQVHLPDSGHLRFLQSRAVISADKARRMLGYEPRFDLAAGMVPTARYLEQDQDASRKAA